MKYDFGGYATKANLLCSDGRTIRKGAFSDQDGERVPLVWQHQKNSPENVLGYVDLEYRPEGMYAYGKFNSTETGKIAKALVEHGDIRSLSIHANKLVQKGGDVLHGKIREVSLVMAGANPGAFIENLCIEHSDGSLEESDTDVNIFADSVLDTEGVEHETKDESASEPETEKGDAKIEHADSEKTVKEVFDTFTDEQKEVVYAMLGFALSQAEEDDEEEAEHSENDEGGTEEMKKNVFDRQGQETDPTLTHDEETEIFKDAKKVGSLKDAVLEHGITDIDILFPEAKAVSTTPDMITRRMDWVAKVWNATRKSPFSRIKSVAANLTEDEARARGYIKGKKKTEEQFGLLKRVTTPQTIYKKQGLDRDDLIDITSFDVVSWMKAEMRMMLNEELARAILVGDGRSASSEDKINPLNIRPIYGDDDQYVIYHTVTYPANADSTDKANAIIDAAHYSRINYRGSGTPVFLTTSETVTMLLLSRDKTGRRIYTTMSELASALRVSEIIEVPVMENVTRTDSESKTTYDLLGLIVNMGDYTVGADRGGAVSMFEDFDIDYNRYKYLIETRCSGALIVPFGAIALETVKSTASETTPVG